MGIRKSELNKDEVMMILSPYENSTESEFRKSSRRKFLEKSLRTVLGGISAATLTATSVSAQSLLGKSSVEQAVSLLFSDLSAAKAVGERYLDLHPHEGNKAELNRKIYAAFGRGRSIRKSVRQEIRQDFANDETVILDGWILARTEVRLCALATFL